jgi:hypothetical protein
MAVTKRYDLARMTTPTTGYGSITLGAAVSGCLTFGAAGAQDQDVVSYAISDGSNSEVGWGVYTASGTTLTRNVIKSTNGNAAINLSGTAQVFITLLAEDTAMGGAQNALPNTPTSGNVTLFTLVDLLPIMTSSTAPSGYVASASTNYSTAPYALTYENPRAQNSGWLTASASTGWIQYQLPVAKVAKGYEIMGWSVDTWNGRVPVAWQFQGSNDGSTWTTLDSQSGQNVNSYQWQGTPYFCLSNNTAYLYYRLNVTANNGNAYMGMSQFKIYGVGAAQTGKIAELFLLDENGNVSKILGMTSVGVIR